MSGKHRNKTIRFRVSERERQEIEAKILVSGMSKKDYFTRSCIYNRVCVVGKEEIVYKIVEKLKEMDIHLTELAQQIIDNPATVTCEDMEELSMEYTDLLNAVIWMLDGARYLWQKNSPDSGN